jgi:hypothetical protein
MHTRRASYGSVPPLNCGVRRQLMPIVAGSVIAFFTFGVPVAVVAWLVFARRWTSMTKVTVVVLER